MLVRNRTLKKMKLVIIYVDPWKDIDAVQEFNLPENIFQINSDISFPKSLPDDPLCMFTNDKIKMIAALPEKQIKDRQTALIF